MVPETQQRYAQQPMAGDQLLAVPAGSQNPGKRVAVRPRANARDRGNPGRDQMVTGPDVLGELQCAIYTRRIRGERSTRYG